MKTLLPPDSVSRGLTRVCDWTVIACGWWLIALSVMTCVEMLGRKLFSFSMQGIDEIGSYTYGIVGAFGFAYTLITRSHTRVDFLLSRFPMKTRALLNLLAMLSLAALSMLCLWRGWHVVVESIELHSTAATPLATPMWIPQSIWLGGYLMFALVAVLRSSMLSATTCQPRQRHSSDSAARLSIASRLSSARAFGGKRESRKSTRVWLRVISV